MASNPYPLTPAPPYGRQSTRPPAPARARAPGSGPGGRFTVPRQLRGGLGLGGLGLDLFQLRVAPAVVAELRELAIDVILAAAELREVGERARLLELARRVGAGPPVLRLLDLAPPRP